MSLSGKVAIAGVYEHPTRWAPERTEFQIMAEAARLFLVEAMRRDLMQFNDTGPSSGVQCDGEGRGPP